MNKKRLVLAVGVVAAAILTVQSITASNMGFKLNYGLVKATDAVPGGTSLTGRQLVALPDNRQSGLNNAKNWIDDVGLAATQRVERYRSSTDLFEFYTGRVLAGQTNFPLAAGEGYRIRMNTTTNYIIVGSDDPALPYQLAKAGDAVAAGGTSLTGRQLYAYNYHQTAANAKNLIDEIGLANVQRIERYLTTTDLFAFYTGRVLAGQTNFTLTPGEAYRIRMNTSVSYTPSHY
jgi:hypothetical protein